jgi:hypothetical protein
MKFFLAVLCILLAGGLIWFSVSNTGNTVSITVLNTPYTDVYIWAVVLFSVLLGVTFAALIAVIEGATIRFDNRRLRREIRKLETEINYLRTQPPSAARPEPDEPEPRSDERYAAPVSRAPAYNPASAPVYDTDRDDWGPDDTDDDDIYSGGRAV